MSLLQAALLGVLQGLTEFLPVSSSGHLILVGDWIGANQSLAFDVALHVGTLFALLAIFSKDYLKLVKDFSRSSKVWVIALGTVPAVIFGLLVGDLAETVFRNHIVVAFTLISVALVMLWAERFSKQSAGLDAIKLEKGWIIGMAQALAIIPGVSRSGATITAGLLLGVKRADAMRFSFLLSGPIIAGAAAKVLLSGNAASEIAANLSVFVVGGVTAAVSGYMAIKFMLRYLESRPLNAFAYYRIALGVVALVVGTL